MGGGQWAVASVWSHRATLRHGDKERGICVQRDKTADQLRLDRGLRVSLWMGRLSSVRLRQESVMFRTVTGEVRERYSDRCPFFHRLLATGCSFYRLPTTAYRLLLLSTTYRLSSTAYRLPPTARSPQFGLRNAYEVSSVTAARDWSSTGWGPLAHGAAISRSAARHHHNADRGPAGAGCLYCWEHWPAHGVS